MVQQYLTDITAPAVAVTCSVYMSTNYFVNSYVI
jgi:hypothetical protein